MTQLTTKIREFSRARDRDHLQLIQDTQSDFMRMQEADDALSTGDPGRPGLPSEFSSGMPDIHYLYKTARQQLLRVAEQSKSAAERHASIVSLAHEQHSAEVAAMRDMQSSLMAQLSDLRVAHGEEPIKQADDCVRAIGTVRAGQRCSVYVRRVVTGSTSSTDDSAPRVHYLRLSVLTSNAHYTSHQLSLLRRYARDPGDAPDGDSDASSAADEQLLSLMLTADRERRMDDIMGMRNNTQMHLPTHATQVTPFAIPAATQMAMRSRRMSLIVQDPVHDAPAVPLGEMQSA